MDVAPRRRVAGVRVSEFEWPGFAQANPGAEGNPQFWGRRSYSSLHGLRAGGASANMGYCMMEVGTLRARVSFANPGHPRTEGMNGEGKLSDHPNRGHPPADLVGFGPVDWIPYNLP